jgi:biopolymer transport protein ExbB
LKMNKYAIFVTAMLLMACAASAQGTGELNQHNETPIQSSVDTNVPTSDSSSNVANRPRNSSTPVALQELSPWSMFLSADPLVKAVMIGLGFASIVTWTIFLARSMQLKFVRWRLQRSMSRILAAETLSEAQMATGRSRNVLSVLLAVAIEELRRSGELSNEEGIKERVASTFSELVRAEARAARQGMGLLATIGATSPFVGLFGTVWGIMNSFIGISKSQTTNLAVVAPGIAEALLATACGLAAAIPAVIIYNHFARATRGYLDLVGRAAGAVRRLLSRDLDRAQGRSCRVRPSDP